MIDDINWASMSHNYGPATDTPLHLWALTTADSDAHYEAVYHLDCAVIHQGAPSEATAPAVRVITDLLARNSVPANLRTDLIDFLGYAAKSTPNPETEAEYATYFADIIPALEGAIIEAYPVVLSLLDDPSPELRRTAAVAAKEFVNTRPLLDRRPDLVQRLHSWSSKPSMDHALWVRLLMDLGADVRSFLDDPNQSARVCAALSPGLADDPKATEIILAALGRAAKVGDTPDRQLFHIDHLVDAAIVRTNGFNQLMRPAVKIARKAAWFGSDWPKLLLVAFPDGYRPGMILTAPQRELLATLVANPKVWVKGSASLKFSKAGLPHDQKECKRIVTQKHTSPRRSRIRRWRKTK